MMRRLKNVTPIQLTQRTINQQMHQTTKLIEVEQMKHVINVLKQTFIFTFHYQINKQTLQTKDDTEGYEKRLQRAKKIKHLNRGAWVNKDNFPAINWSSVVVNYRTWVL